VAIPITEFEPVEQHDYDLLQSSDEIGPIQRALRRPEKIRRFRLVWKLASLADRDAVAAEFIAAKGGAGTFSFTPVDEVTPVTVRFVEDSFRWDWVDPARVTMEIELEQELY